MVLPRLGSAVIVGLRLPVGASGAEGLVAPSCPARRASSTEVIPDRRGAGHSTVTEAATDRRVGCRWSEDPTGGSHEDASRVRRGQASRRGRGRERHQAGRRHRPNRGAPRLRPHRAVRLLRPPRRLARSLPPGADSIQPADWRRRWWRRLGFARLERYACCGAHRRWTHNRGHAACPVPRSRRSCHKRLGGRFERRRDGNVSARRGLLGHRGHAWHLSDLLATSRRLSQRLPQGASTRVARSTLSADVPTCQYGVDLMAGSVHARVGKRQCVVRASASAFTTSNATARRPAITAPAKATTTTEAARRPGGTETRPRLGSWGRQSRPLWTGRRAPCHKGSP